MAASATRHRTLCEGKDRIRSKRPEDARVALQHEGSSAIKYALRRVSDRSLVMGEDNMPTHPFTFGDAHDAIEWVRANCQPGGTVEWT
jgi:hypothetical protein